MLTPSSFGFTNLLQRLPPSGLLPSLLMSSPKHLPEYFHNTDHNETRDRHEALLGRTTVLKTAFEMAGGSAPGSAKVSPFQNPCFQVEMICSTARSQFPPNEKILKGRTTKGQPADSTNRTSECGPGASAAPGPGTRTTARPPRGVERDTPHARTHSLPPTATSPALPPQDLCTSSVRQ